MSVSCESPVSASRVPRLALWRVLKASAVYNTFTRDVRLPCNCHKLQESYTTLIIRFLDLQVNRICFVLMNIWLSQANEIYYFIDFERCKWIYTQRLSGHILKTSGTFVKKLYVIRMARLVWIFADSFPLLAPRAVNCPIKWCLPQLLPCDVLGSGGQPSLSCSKKHFLIK